MVYQHQETRPRPEEARKVAPVPGCGVDHVRGEDIDNDGGHVVRHTRQRDGLDLEASR